MLFVCKWVSLSLDIFLCAFHGNVYVAHQKSHVQIIYYICYVFCIFKYILGLASFSQENQRTFHTHTQKRPNCYRHCIVSLFFLCSFIYFFICLIDLLVSQIEVSLTKNRYQRHDLKVCSYLGGDRRKKNHQHFLDYFHALLFYIDLYQNRSKSRKCIASAGNDEISETFGWWWEGWCGRRCFYCFRIYLQNI